MDNSQKEKTDRFNFERLENPSCSLCVGDEYVEEVLDGQQRLAAIRDFYCNRISVDGILNQLMKNL